MHADKQTTDDLIAYLRAHVIAVVSTVTSDSKPESAAVFYWVNDIKDGDFSLFFVTRRNTRKFHNLMFNPEVSVVVGTEFQPSTVQIQGQAELLESATGLGDLTRFAKRMGRRQNLAKIYAGEFLPRNPFGKLEGENFAVIKVRPTWLRWMRLDLESKKIVFHQLIGRPVRRVVVPVA